MMEGTLSLVQLDIRTRLKMKVITIYKPSEMRRHLVR